MFTIFFSGAVKFLNIGGVALKHTRPDKKGFWICPSNGLALRDVFFCAVDIGGVNRTRPNETGGFEICPSNGLCLRDFFFCGIKCLKVGRVALEYNMTSV